MDRLPGRADRPSSVSAELPRLVKYLERPYVHLALDPEFAMKNGGVPGRRMGTMDAADVNHAVRLLADIVERKKLPPKVLVVHRFTKGMLTNHEQITLDPRVQVVIDMDGYGAPWHKETAYKWFIVQQPVQYTGFKLFFKNDKPMMTPAQVIRLWPSPLYVPVHSKAAYRHTTSKRRRGDRAAETPPALERPRQRLHVRPRPRLLEPLVRGSGLLGSPLRGERLREAVERPAVVRVPHQVLSVGLLGLLRTAGGQQHRPQLLAQRQRPGGRLVVGSSSSIAIPARIARTASSVRRCRAASRRSDDGRQSGAAHAPS